MNPLLIGLAVALAPPSSPLPARYFELISEGLRPVEQRLGSEPLLDLTAAQQTRGWRHFPSAMLGAAVLYAKRHPTNPRYRDPKMLDLAPACRRSRHGRSEERRVGTDCR